MYIEDIPPAAVLAFIKIAELGSITAASKELGISQSAVSQTLDRLENKLGTRLVNRETRPLKLTIEGNRFSNAARRFIEEVRIFDSAISSISNNELISLKVGISEVASEFFSEDLEKYLIPKMNYLEVKSGLIPQIVEEFENGLLDLVISPDVVSSPSIKSIKLLTERYFVVCHKRYRQILENFGKTDSFREVGLPFLSYRSNSSDRRKAQRFLRKIGLNAAVDYELENTRAVINAVENGLGWTILPPLNIFLGTRLEQLVVKKIEDRDLTKSLFVASSNHHCFHLLDEIETLFKSKFSQKSFRAKLQANPNLETGYHIEVN